MISTRLTERFGIRHPIVCAPMALVTGGDSNPRPLPCQPTTDRKENNLGRYRAYSLHVSYLFHR